MSSISEFTLIVPGVSGRLRDWSQRGESIPLLPIMERILSLSDCRELDFSGYESTLWSVFDPLFSSADALPAGVQLSGDRSGQVCCADPVHLRLDMGKLMLIDQSQFSVTEAERVALSELLNTYLAGLGGKFFFNKNGRGFLGLSESRSVNTTPLSEVMGCSIFSRMPRGEQQTFWHQLINEVQMLLHSAPFNTARAERNEPSINALWIWGAGPLQRPLVADYSKVYCNDSFARDLALSVGVSVQPVPERYSQALIPGSGKSLLVFNDLLAHSQYDDFPGWKMRMEKFSVDWLEPLLHSVWKKQLSRLSLYLCDGSCYVIEPAHRRRFWRRSKPLLSSLLEPE
jgi:hypothetical protein